MLHVPQFALCSIVCCSVHCLFIRQYMKSIVIDNKKLAKENKYLNYNMVNFTFDDNIKSALCVKTNIGKMRWGKFENIPHETQEIIENIMAIRRSKFRTRLAITIIPSIIMYPVGIIGGITMLSLYSILDIQSKEMINEYMNQLKSYAKENNKDNNKYFYIDTFGNIKWTDNRIGFRWRYELNVA